MDAQINRRGAHRAKRGATRQDKGQGMARRGAGHKAFQSDRRRRMISSDREVEYKLHISQIFADKQMPWPIILWNHMRTVYSMGSTEGKAGKLIAKT